VIWWHSEKKMLEKGGEGGALRKGPTYSRQVHPRMKSCHKKGGSGGGIIIGGIRKFQGGTESNGPGKGGP